jgi:translation initiation factor 2 alpha subunit (eIF-2alpha)
MPNGQLVEWYIPLRELEDAKKAGNHALFEKWRNKTKEDKTENWNEYQADLADSFDRYMSAFQAAINRLGLSELATEASWKKVEEEVVSVTRSKLSLRSSAEGISLSQEPFFNTTENSLQAT